ncbi:hypothetical protein [Candidatus Oscillochloris fontis]|uniref:hypothetical protein n=1 Tax=Candidatus Oscillochloris fontis TaxID=2496868 RepID=UPI00101C248B|nr:hypothetical protein [Candidatus Oscillochloris fontis]
MNSYTLTPPQQQSARNLVQTIKVSPRAAHYYHTATQRDGTTRAVWVAYGLTVRILFTLAEDGRSLIARIFDVAPSDLPGIADYEES